MRQRRRRDELLSATLFHSLPHARATLEGWRRDERRRVVIWSSVGWRLGTAQLPREMMPAGVLCYAGAARPGLLPTTKHKAQNNPARYPTTG
jgi:hypothetical protein